MPVIATLNKPHRKLGQAESSTAWRQGNPTNSPNHIMLHQSDGDLQRSFAISIVSQSRQYVSVYSGTLL
ncbi:hypothetical protein IIA29_08980 [candidate division KSB1 bacterium]|nr:hypothetical protein [candidate division KSB1 bacterium]